MLKRIILSLGIGVFLLTSVPVFAGAISGQIIYKGKRPKLREIKMGADPICLMKHDKPVTPDTLVLGENQEMKNVFLRIVEGLPKKKWPMPTEAAVLDQKGCRYEPPVLGLMVNQPVRILNPDGTLHNVHALSKKNPEFNLAMPKFRKEVTKTFAKEEFMFQIKCDVHPWMVSHISILNHPFFTTTDADGKYTIDNLPPGEYVLEAWQQRLEPQRVKIAIKDGETQTQDFTFSRPDGK